MSNAPSTPEEANFTLEQKVAYEAMLFDYKVAASLVGYTGVLSPKIAIALIQEGWRKQAN